MLGKGEGNSAGPLRFFLGKLFMFGVIMILGRYEVGSCNGQIFADTADFVAPWLVCVGARRFVVA